jgi:hypothetical protein
MTTRLGADLGALLDGRRRGFQAFREGTTGTQEKGGPEGRMSVSKGWTELDVDEVSLSMELDDCISLPVLQGGLHKRCLLSGFVG